MKSIPFNNYSNTFVFDTRKKGPTITIFWWIHGNEKSGLEVIDRLREDIENKKIILQKGKLILAYGNEKAIEIWKRDYLYNLNRLFKQEYFESNSDEYEIKRVKQLKHILDETDILLDIHSVSSESEAFMFVENIQTDLEIAKHIFWEKIIIWWGEIAWDLLWGDTDGYVHSLGKVWFTFECGNHYEQGSFKKGLKTSLLLLQYVWMIAKKYERVEKQEVNMFEMYKIATTKTGKFKFETNIKNFDCIQRWKLLWFDGWKEVYAEQDFYILLPNFEKTKIGDEIYYFWKKI